jgi:hypothetical protein
MRWVHVVWLIAGCGFSTSTEPGGGDPGDPSDDPGDPGDPTDDPGPGPIAAVCDVSDPSLRLCLTFDQSPMVDLASPPHALAELAGVTPLPIAGHTVAELGAQSQIRFAEATDLDVAELTVDLWIAPARISRRRSYWLFDNDTQYAASYEDDERVRCRIGDEVATSEQSFQDGWHHVACRYDAAERELRVYVDGSVAGCTTISNGIPTTGTGGLAIGANYEPTGTRDRFIGRLDGVHLYARALPSTEICLAARRTNCNSSCREEDD